MKKYKKVEMFCISLTSGELNIFSCIFWLFLLCLEKCLSPLPIFKSRSFACFLLLHGRNSLCVLDFNPLSDMFPNIFSHFISCLFTVDCFLCCAEFF